MKCQSYGLTEAARTFTRSWLSLGPGFENIHQLEDIGRAIVAVDNCFHRVALCRGEVVTVVGRPPIGDKQQDESDN